jgi:hypothetical protein
MIIKTKINENTINLEYLHILLQNYISKNNYIGNISLDYKNNIRVDENLIPFTLYNHIIFKYNNTFQQNNKLLSNKIRKNVLHNCTNICNITCIGGESFIYPILLKLNNFNFYSDSKKLVEESIFNFNIYTENSINKCKIIDYNKCINFDCYENLILNLDTLNKNLMKIINKKKLYKIIIINCNHTDFWKKLKHLTNYKLIKRTKFISNNYFISVNLLIS